MEDYSVMDACIEGDEIFFFDNWMQALCKYVISKESVEILEFHSGNVFNAYHIFIDGKDIFITSSTSLDYLRYDRKQKEMQCMEFINMKYPHGMDFLFDFHMYRNKEIWSFPYNLNYPVYVCDTDDRTVRECWFWNSESGRLADRSIHFANGRCEKYYASFFGSNKLIEIDLAHNKCRKIALSDNDIRVGSVDFDGRNFWIASTDGRVFRADADGRIISEYDGNEKTVENEYSRVICGDKNVYILPRKGNHFLKIYPLSSRTMVINLDNMEGYERKETGNSSKILGGIKCHNRMFFWGNGLNGILEMHEEDDTGFVRRIKFTKSERGKILAKWMMESGTLLYMEDDRFGLEEYLYAIGVGIQNIRNRIIRTVKGSGDI